MSRRPRTPQLVAGGACWALEHDEEDRREFRARCNLTSSAKYDSNHRRLRGTRDQVPQTKRGRRATQTQAAGQIAGTKLWARVKGWSPNLNQMPLISVSPSPLPFLLDPIRWSENERLTQYGVLVARYGQIADAEERPYSQWITCAGSTMRSCRWQHRQQVVKPVNSGAWFCRINQANPSIFRPLSVGVSSATHNVQWTIGDGIPGQAKAFPCSTPSTSRQWKETGATVSWSVVMALQKTLCSLLTDWSSHSCSGYQTSRWPRRHSLTTYRRYTDQCSLRAIAELFRKERPSISRARSVVAPRSNYTGRFLCPSCCSHTGRSSWFLEHSTARQPALPKRTMRCCLEGRVLRHHNRAGAVPSSWII